MSTLRAEADLPLPQLLGEAWARDVVHALRTQTRSVVGSWPGTLREARHRVFLGLPQSDQAKLDHAALDALSRAVYVAARRCWDDFSEPDLEP